jgi:AcrR family transcriptional regulator
MSDSKRKRRRYDSPLRRQRAAETRERIISAGVELLHGFAVWNWHALTVRAVAKRAGVNERTVYRHFANEQELRDAVLARLTEEAGVDLTGLQLDELREVTTRILEFVSTFPLEPRTIEDPTLLAAGRRNREALVAAVAPHVAGWSEEDRALVAPMLDVLWSVASYERLVADWKLEPEQAIRGITWVMGLVEDALRNDRPPGR